MKPEARVLVSLCSESGCAGLVVRGRGFDSFLYARDCDGICLRAAERGYIHEFRYGVGDCTCGFPEPPRRREEYAHLLRFLGRLLEEIGPLVERGLNSGGGRYSHH